MAEAWLLRLFDGAALDGGLRTSMAHPSTGSPSAGIALNGFAVAPSEPVQLVLPFVAEAFSAAGC